MIRCCLDDDTLVNGIFKSKFLKIDQNFMFRKFTPKREILNLTITIY